METNDYIEVVAREGTLFAAAADRGGLDTPIPSCPEWDMRKLVQHLGHSDSLGGRTLSSNVSRITKQEALDLSTRCLW